MLFQSYDDIFAYFGFSKILSESGKVHYIMEFLLQIYKMMSYYFADNHA